MEQTSKYHIWNKRYDFSEINRFNYHQLLRQYFQITTKKIALLAMLLVINIICAVLSRFVLGLGTIGGFLTIAITFWTIILAYVSLNGFYAFVFLEITVWFRMALGNDVIQTAAINISDLTFLIVFALIVFLINKIRYEFKNPKSKKWSYFIVLSIAMFIAILATSGLNVGYNKWFLISLYYKTTGAKVEIDSWLLITIFWFNIVQYLINCLIFVAIYNVSYTLINRYF